MEFVIQTLRQKKVEVLNDLDVNNQSSVMATSVILDQIDKAIKVLEYEFYWKDLQTN
jgi:hypothetical protein